MPEPNKITKEIFEAFNDGGTWEDSEKRKELEGMRRRKKPSPRKNNNWQRKKHLLPIYATKETNLKKTYSKPSKEATTPMDVWGAASAVHGFSQQQQRIIKKQKIHGGRKTKRRKRRKVKGRRTKRRRRKRKTKKRKRLKSPRRRR